MDWQALAAAALVVACSGYAAWSLAPKALKRRVSGAFGLKVEDSGACGGCDGCGGAAPPAGAAPTVSVIRIVKRPPSSD